MKQFSLPRLAILAASCLSAYAAPAMAADRYLGNSALPSGDMRYGYDVMTWQNTTAGASTPLMSGGMHTFTVTDRTGVVLAALTSMFGTEANRMNAEREAIRSRKTSYSYAVREAAPNPDMLLSLTTGFSAQGGYAMTAAGGAAAPLDASLVRVDLGFDMFPLLGGVVAFDTGMGSFSSTSATGSVVAPKAVMLAPIGLSWRWVPDLPVLNNLVLRPFAHLDWADALSRKGFGANDFGLSASLVLSPYLQLDARHAVSSRGVTTGTTTELGYTTTTLGTTMYF
ncbi:MAG TPA: hypothetical protein V6D00_04320 [Pantanalinema sp.]